MDSLCERFLSLSREDSEIESAEMYQSPFVAKGESPTSTPGDITRSALTIAKSIFTTHGLAMTDLSGSWPPTTSGSRCEAGRDSESLPGSRSKWKRNSENPWLLSGKGTGTPSRRVHLSVDDVYVVADPKVAARAIVPTTDNSASNGYRDCCDNPSEPPLERVLRYAVTSCWRGTLSTEHDRRRWPPVWGTTSQDPNNATRSTLARVPATPSRTPTRSRSRSANRCSR